MNPARLAIVTTSTVLIALGTGLTPAGAQQVGVQVLPMKGPPGAPVSIQVSNCPAGTTTVAVRHTEQEVVVEVSRSPRTAPGARRWQRTSSPSSSRRGNTCSTSSASTRPARCSAVP